MYTRDITREHLLSDDKRYKAQKHGVVESDTFSLTHSSGYKEASVCGWTEREHASLRRLWSYSHIIVGGGVVVIVVVVVEHDAIVMS